jgi:hypothetical protein
MSGFSVLFYIYLASYVIVWLGLVKLKVFVYCFCLFTLLKDDQQILVYHEKNHQKEAEYERENTFFLKIYCIFTISMYYLHL